MKNTTLHFPTAKRDGLRKAVCGVAAMAATAATLGLTVLAPVAAAPAEPMVQALVDTRRLVLGQGPGEVAIVPSRIDVIAIRTPHTNPVSAQGAVRQRS
jgi:ApbE superfamily uncharacterized protein (UPF0280 family)